VKIVCPGKAMLAGEYAVLSQTGVAAAVAVEPPGMVLEAHPADRWQIASPQDDPFATAALELTTDVQAAPQSLRLSLFPSDAAKVGAGMSAAACASVVAAVFTAAGRNIQDSSVRAQLLARALRAHRKAQGGRGSGYDVATVVHGGLVVTRTEEDGAVSVYRREPPEGLALARLPSGIDAPTTGLIDRVAGVDPGPLRGCAERVTAAADVRSMLDALEEAQRSFEQWNATNQLGLMPPRLQELVSVVRSAGFIARVSGAGGGDSVLAAGDDIEALTAQISRWQKDGMDAEILRVAKRGVRVKSGQRSKR